MGTLDQTLAQHVDELLGSYRRERLLSTTGTRAAVEELGRRNEGLERIVRELALEVERLAAEMEESRAPATSYSIRYPAEL